MRIYNARFFFPSLTRHIHYSPPFLYPTKQKKTLSLSFIPESLKTLSTKEIFKFINYVDTMKYDASHCNPANTELLLNTIFNKLNVTKRIQTKNIMS